MPYTSPPPWQHLASALTLDFIPNSWNRLFQLGASTIHANHLGADTKTPGPRNLLPHS